MLKPQIQSHKVSTAPLFNLPTPFTHRNSLASVALGSRSITSKLHIKNYELGSSSRRAYSGKVKASVSATSVEESVKVKAKVTLSESVVGSFTDISIDRGLDTLTDAWGKPLLLELVSSELDPKTGQDKPTIQGYAHKVGQEKDNIRYEAEFTVPPGFGEIGAVFIENEYHTEVYVQDILLDGLPFGPLHVTCNSWVHSKFDNDAKRVFFTDKSYLPSQTPDGLKRFREHELAIQRGNGTGERTKGERIYDYDVYNDLGDPDSNSDLARPVLGGSENPYPRRCRTGRPRCKKDPYSETRSSSFYVPRDEEFAEVKNLTFSSKTLYSVVHAVVPALETSIVNKDLGFPLFSEINKLFDEGVNIPTLTKEGWKDILPNLFRAVSDGVDGVLKFETPPTMERDGFFWLRDEEFARQTLAGLHPCALKLITEWPLKSTLDPKTYGPPESAITTELLEREIKGFITVEEAIKQKKLFILDYHDALLPYVSFVRGLEGTTLYGSRTVFFLTPEGTLKPLAIELTRPPIDGKPQWKRVFTPSLWSTDVWLWRIAKAHVLAHDSGYHQLISHWLRTHCCTEPYIIAANRQLSAMHPIYRLLHPHFRYTMEINALARQYLINAGGIIESSFSPGKYSMQLSSAIYDQVWRFDREALPNDLIARGMAVEDPTALHGLKLTIEDYPYANDGLALWDIIKEWVTEYVSHYYPDPNLVESDEELQAWWSEVREKGHADKKDEPWWPQLKTSKDLIKIITTIVWVTSGHHAAVNFGQYPYAAYFPNRPTIARKKMPIEDPTEEELDKFWEKPEVTLLSTFPSQLQAVTVLTILDVLSNHSPDEEYLGQYCEPAWAADPNIKAAFEKFNGRLVELEGIIDERNSNRDLKNRNGAGMVPYELLKPFSDSGVTGKGVPYSISI